MIRTTLLASTAARTTNRLLLWCCLVTIPENTLIIRNCTAVSVYSIYITTIRLVHIEIRIHVTMRLDSKWLTVQINVNMYFRNECGQLSWRRHRVGWNELVVRYSIELGFKCVDNSSRHGRQANNLRNKYIFGEGSADASIIANDPYRMLFWKQTNSTNTTSSSILTRIFNYDPDPR